VKFESLESNALWCND